MADKTEPFTFQNVWERRAEFEAAVKEVKNDRYIYYNLTNSASKREFMRLVYNRFDWINENINNFEPKFDFADSFGGGRLARVEQGGKWGYIKKNGKYCFEPQFDHADNSQRGCAWIMKDGKWGCIMEYGKYYFEPQFDAFYINNSKDYVVIYSDGRKFKLRTKELKNG